MQIKKIISKEGRKNLKKAEKRLEKLLEVTQCIICKKYKPLSEFAEDKSGYLGFSNICKQCSCLSKSNSLTKECKLCGQLKEYNHFYKYNSYYYDYCIECTRKIIDEKAANGLLRKCSKCGKTMPASTKYFDVELHCKDLIRTTCKKCDLERRKQKKQQFK